MKPIHFLFLICTLITILSVQGCGDADPTGTEPSQSDASPAKTVPASNIEMAQELKTIAANVPPDQTWNSNSVAAEYYRGLMEKATGPEKVSMRIKYADQLLNAGKTEQAITEFTGVIDDLKQLGAGLTNQTKPVYEMLAIAYMRLGEEANCGDRHNAESCLIPFSPQAIHKLRAGSENAIIIYKRILENWPDDLQTRYLLNLAYMTLGEYPDNVPPQHLIENIGEVSKSVGINKFRDVAIQSGVDIDALSGGVCLDDFNNDGLIDIVASSWGLHDPIRYLVNKGDGTFEDKSEEAGIGGIVSGLNMIHADYNNDGFVDVFVLRGAWLGESGKHPNSLLRNNGDNTFTDVTREAGVYTRRPTQAAVWADFNLDGWIDLFVGNESSPGDANPCEMYLNNGDGTFRDVVEHTQANVLLFAKGVAAGDINNDGWPELFISNLSGPNILLLNNGITQEGIPKFVDISSRAGVEKPLQAFPTWFWDYNQDGWEDLFVSSYDLQGFSNLSAQFSAELLGEEVTAEGPRLYLNNGGSKFTETSDDANLNKVMFAMGSNVGDIDNDGFPDFYVGNGAPGFRMIIPNRMFLNATNGAFTEVTYEGGFGHIQKGHAVAFADLDNDGDQDVYCVMGGAVEGDTYPNVLFENPGNSNSWLSLLLEGKSSNRSAIGARIKVIGTGANGKSVVRYHTVSSGGSFGASSLRAEIGLGDMTSVDRIEVQWPVADRTIEQFGAVEPGAAYRIVEGSGKAVEINLPVFRFSDPT